VLRHHQAGQILGEMDARGLIGKDVAKLEQQFFDHLG
jgi:hypothetical protein